MLEASVQKNDKLARVLIYIVSAVVFIAVVILSQIELKVDLGFNVHIFATINAVINSIVAILLVAALIAVKKFKFLLHKNLMLTAIVLSTLFLVSYIAHHLLTGDTNLVDKEV